MVKQAARATTKALTHRQGMVWVELTNGCNLNCRHCYSDSYPGSQIRDTLSHDDYVRIVSEAADADMSTLQFIGGEPLLYKRLPELVSLAQELAFERVEILSNLTVGRPDVLGIIDRAVTTVATSVYSFDPNVHDAIVKKPGSFQKTIANIREVVSRGIALRARFIEMETNEGHYDRTEAFLLGLGVASVGCDRIREFGRSGGTGSPELTQLCGTCSGNTVCITYDGTVLPCIMSRAWPIGTITSSNLKELIASDRAVSVRQQIWQATKDKWGPSPGGAASGPEGSCNPHACEPTMPDCMPRCQPGCSPGQNCTPCNPHGSQPCYPNQRCNPIGCGKRY